MNQTLEKTMIADTNKAINRFKQLDNLAGIPNTELSFYKGTKYEKLDKGYPYDQFMADKKLLRKFYHGQGDVAKSMDVLNWSRTKVRNHAFVLK